MKIGLFVPCYVDALYPEVGVATYKLLRSLGVEVDYPESQTCCGQPMGNAGFENMSGNLAEKYDDLFSGFDYVVAPSASCAAYVRLFHPEILKHDCVAAKKTLDLVEFLHDVLKVDHLPSKFSHKVSIHNSCHGVRELGLSRASELGLPYFNKLRDLLSMVNGIEVFEPEHPDECCGFGGMFAVEEPEVSICMGQDKVHHHMNTGAEYITGADSSCLMHMQGVIDREHLPIKTIHIVQILAAGL